VKVLAGMLLLFVRFRRFEKKIFFLFFVFRTSFRIGLIHISSFVPRLANRVMVFSLFFCFSNFDSAFASAVFPEPIDHVWKVVRDFAAVPKTFPTVERLEGN
jgi:hypothetical protein